MDNRTFGYARVSTREQNEDRQIEALTDFGVSKDNIIVDKCSGKDTEREGYQYLKKQILRSGDTLVIKELDRLSRNKADVKRELEFFKKKGVHIRIHFKAMGLYVYTSTESIMKNALKKVFLNKFFYERIDTIDGDILKINCYGSIERSGFDTHRDYKFGGWYDDYDMYYTMHEQLLLDMCGCFGVDEDDVIMLLDYGYSADEIESMLMDYDMISETVNAVKNMEEPYTICG